MAITDPSSSRSPFISFTHEGTQHIVEREHTGGPVARVADDRHVLAFQSKAAKQLRCGQIRCHEQRGSHGGLDRLRLQRALLGQEQVLQMDDADDAAIAVHVGIAAEVMGSDSLEVLLQRQSPRQDDGFLEWPHEIGGPASLKSRVARARATVARHG
jgi:hypothetical protein